MSNNLMNTSDNVPLMDTQDQKHLQSPPPVPVESEIQRMDLQAENKKIARAALFRQIWMFAGLLIIDIGLPLAVFYIVKMFTSELIALLLSGIPPLLHVIVNFIRKRRIEVIGCICIFSFVLSAIMTLISGNARIALLRDSTTTAVIGAAFFITLIPLRTPWFKLFPLTYLVGQQMTSELAPITWTDYEGQYHSLMRAVFYWERMHIYRRHHYIITALWGCSLMLEFIIKVIMITATPLSIEEIMLYGVIAMGILTIIPIIVVIVTYRRMARKCSAFQEEWLKANDYSSTYPPQVAVGSDNTV